MSWIEEKDSVVRAEKMGFNIHDLVQINEHGVSLDTIENQLKIFREGISKTKLDRPALIGDGIQFYSDDEFLSYSDLYDKNKSGLVLKKFVPASGAATRMFKFLSEFLNEYILEKESVNAYINRKNNSELKIFIAGLEKLPFYEDVNFILDSLFSDFENFNSDKKLYYFIKVLLDPKYLDYANKPKAVLPFHKYKEGIATPIEEHLKECAVYASSNNNSKLHLTISENHLPLFEEIIQTVKEKIEEETGTIIQINYSFQSKSTDTLAVGFDNKPFRDKNDKLVFRPGGHGALIENLNHLNADLIFVKNIDNVVRKDIVHVSFYKKGLAGILIELKDEIFSVLNKIDNNESIDIASVLVFMMQKLNIEISKDFDKFTQEHKLDFIKSKLNRPIRVCGMVKNEGEPGGGPFWVKNTQGDSSLQIVESSQIDLNNPGQAEILSQSTHFNPVDLVCFIKDYKGDKFDLNSYIDHNTGFIVYKNKDGKELKGYELPGLWNGAMADWITIFVEVPLITFNPVKTINDLLKPAHQLS